MAIGKQGCITVTSPSYNKGAAYIDFHWQEDYDIASNSSTIAITGVTVTHSLYAGRFYVNGTVAVNGAVFARLEDNRWSGVVTQTGSHAQLTGGNLPMVSVSVPHDSVSGALDITLQVEITSCFCNSAGWRGGTGKTSSTVSLTTIPRISTVPETAGNIGENVLLNIKSASPSFTHTLTYAFGSASGTIAENTDRQSLVWVPPMELCREIPQAASGTCTITCTTYMNGSFIGSSTSSVTLTVPSGVGLTLTDGWVTLRPYNDSTAAQGIALFVQGYSKAEAVFDESKIGTDRAYGAWVAAFSITMDGKTYSAPYRTPTLTAAEKTITATATDSRGRTVSQNLTLTVQPYAKPTLTDIAVFRSNEQGRADDSGYYITAKATAVYSGLEGVNRPQLFVRYRPAAGDYGAEIPMESGKTKVIGGAIQPTQTYFAEITVRDGLGFSSTYTQPIPTATVFFHGRKGGKGAAFGKYAEADGVLEIDWGLKVQGRSLLDWLHPVGSVYISADAASPAKLFGGDWLQLNDVFLLAAGDTYKVGTRGGEAAHKLLQSELPETLPIAYGGSYTSGKNEPVIDRTVAFLYGTAAGRMNMAVGEGRPINNMPPYLTVNVWKRVK